MSLADPDSEDKVTRSHWSLQQNPTAHNKTLKCKTTA